ncbi:putative serine protease K12H4.7 [Bradysia coprophila]|uniref:putative serine protease K12H4.7 n=1 Tax=Bradysia coprophila TaxID=38358 RepID=UPI00187DA1CB|nr:putative serine protease K12H4.7 [Bradysia coprophila]
MRLKFCLNCVILLSVMQTSFGWRQFWKGRRTGGNVRVATAGNVPRFWFAPITEWFDQLLDHFNTTNTATWKQRFYTNNAYYKPEGPVFLMIGGEGAATSDWMTDGAWVPYAKEHKALCFLLEHRFYGLSQPTEDLSTENLVYLSSEQALADLAYFIIAMKKKFNLNHDTKWIAFGGSYPGSLAAWLRLKYPHLVHGSISSSGPLQAKADFKEYFEVVKDSLGSHSDDCVTAVRKSIQQVEILLKHRIGRTSLNDKFELCDPVENSIENPLDLSTLFESLASNFARVVQYNDDFRHDNAENDPMDIDDVCRIMVNSTIGTPVDRLAEVNRLLLMESGYTCLEYKYDKMLDEMRNTSWEGDAAYLGDRQWTYQTCTEFGFYQTSGDKSLLFGNRFPLEFFIEQCKDIFGKQFDGKFLDKAIFRCNTNYGALDAETTNVIYIHGSIDPWHALGLTKAVNSQMPVIYINGTAHCANMYDPADNDLPQLKAARVEINKFIKNLIQS